MSMFSSNINKKNEGIHEGIFMILEAKFLHTFWSNTIFHFRLLR